MSKYSCSHLDSVPNALETYNVVLRYYVSFSLKSLHRKANDAYCRVCKAATRKLHACLECAFFGCLVSENLNISHMKEHAQKFKHNFAINLNHGALFCFQCDDYIYNEAFDDALNKFNLKARSENLTRAYMPWMPDFREVVPLKGKIIRIPDNSNFGLRGIVNVGNSCYINCVIQVLMHTPVLVNHFLSDKHICSLSDSCLWCELHYIFQEFYSFKSTPFDPSERLFNALQKFCKQPLGMEQQDSYELFQEILMGLHANCPKTKAVTDCNCMIQKIFYGIIQGFKKCSYCNDSSFLPPDYFMDILLDLDKKDDSLVNVLRRKYLEPHLLSDYKCSNCQKTDTTSSYQHIKKLPKVICFRMNCFLLEFNKNAPVRSRNRKISKKSTAFAFEEFIDMMPYLNSKGAANISDGKKVSLNASENFYKLFAVIFHKGTAQAGHYLAYVRHQNTKWYECNDKLISECNFEDVLHCEPFLLFYQK